MPPYRVALTQHVAARKYPSGSRCQHRSPSQSKTPCSSCSASRGWALMDASSGTRRRPRPLPPAIPGEAPHHQTQVGVDRGQHRRHRRGGRTCPHIAWADQDDEIGGIQRCLGGIGQTTWKIADHGDSPRRPASITASTGPASNS